MGLRDFKDLHCTCHKRQNNIPTMMMDSQYSCKFQFRLSLDCVQMCFEQSSPEFNMSQIKPDPYEVCNIGLMCNVLVGLHTGGK